MSGIINDRLPKTALAAANTAPVANQPTLGVRPLVKFPLQGQAPDCDRPEVASKAAALAELFGRPETYGMGVEIKLFIRLQFAEEGKLAGTWQELGVKLATDGRNLKLWADKLERAGMATVGELGGKRVTVTLRAPYLEIAIMKEDEQKAPAEKAPVEDPELSDLINVYRTAKETGSSIDVTTKRSFGLGKPA